MTFIIPHANYIISGYMDTPNARLRSGRVTHGVLKQSRSANNGNNGTKQEVIICKGIRIGVEYIYKGTLKRKDFSELKDCVRTLHLNDGVILISAMHGLARYAHSSATCRIINKQGAYSLSTFV